MIKPTKHSLKKLESLFEVLGYDIRYERGNFQSGYCIVQDKKIAVINKFFDTAGRMDCLIDILHNMDTEAAKELIEDPKMQTFFKQILKNKTLEEDQ